MIVRRNSTDAVRQPLSAMSVGGIGYSADESIRGLPRHQVRSGWCRNDLARHTSAAVRRDPVLVDSGALNVHQLYVKRA